MSQTDPKTAFVEAARKGDLAQLQALALAHPTKQWNYAKALCEAVEGNHVTCVAFLLDNDTRPDEMECKKWVAMDESQVNCYRKALWSSVKHADTACLRLVRAALTALRRPPTDFFVFAAQVAGQEGNTEAVDLLLEVVDPSYATMAHAVLMLAARQGHCDTVAHIFSRLSTSSWEDGSGIYSPEEALVSVWLGAKMVSREENPSSWLSLQSSITFLKKHVNLIGVEHAIARAVRQSAWNREPLAALLQWAQTEAVRHSLLEAVEPTARQNDGVGRGRKM